MKSMLVLFTVLNFCYLPAFSQEMEWEWSIQSFSTCQDQVTDMVIDDVNNCYLSGFYTVGEFHIGDSVFYEQDGDFKTFISSFDREGNFRWAVSLQKEQSGVFGMVADCLMAVDSQQNLYITGNFDFSVDFGDTILYSIYNWDVFVAKYDSSGQFIWAYRIGGSGVDEVGDIKIDDQDNIYIGISHSRPNLDNYIVYGDNDTTVYYSDYAASVLSLLANGEFSWLSCGTSSTEVQTSNLALDNENNLYVQFWVFGEFLLNGETIVGDLEPFTFVVVPYDEAGLPGDYMKYPQYWPGDMVIDSQGEFITTGVFNEPIIILGDTLIPSGSYSYDRLLVKYNRQMEPEWYLAIPNTSYTLDFSVSLDHDDGIYFSAPFEGELVFGDTILPWAGEKGLFIAKFHPYGSLEWAVTIPGSDFIYTSALNLDHCGNVLLGGGFNEDVYFGGDTLSSSPEGVEVFIAKLSNEMGFLSLGNDTVACESLQLAAPEGYQYYSWNNGSSYDNYFTATETGSYSLLAIDEHFCTDADTIFVEIRPLPQVDLGSDTLVYISNTLSFSVDPQNDSILWSDGTTGADFIFNAMDYGEGYHIIWVQLGENGCYNTDSINIHVFDNSSLGEQALRIDHLFPNPARDKLYFDLSHTGLIRYSHLTVEVRDIKGQLKVCGLINDFDGNPHPGHILDISTLAEGMYFLLVKEGQKVIAEEKFVVLE
jgi:hypothetical protein